MKTKNWIRLVVASALLAWPGVETYRYYVATQQLAAATQLQESVTMKVAQLKAARMAQPTKPGPATPVQNPAPAKTPTTSRL
jgi:hypothetical protein